MVSQPAGATRTSEAAAVGALSSQEFYRLTLFKWRYSFEALGFSPAQVSVLVFLKWLHATRRVQP